MTITQQKKQIVSEFLSVPNAVNCQTLVLIEITSIHPLDMECLFNSALEESVFPVNDAAGVPVYTVVVVNVCSATADFSVSPYLQRLWCSFSLVIRGLPVSPM